MLCIISGLFGWINAEVEGLQGFLHIKPSVAPHLRTTSFTLFRFYTLSFSEDEETEADGVSTRDEILPFFLFAYVVFGDSAEAHA